MDKKKMEELMSKRTAPAAGRQVVKSIDLLEPATAGQDGGSSSRDGEATSISSAKAPSIQATEYESAEAGRKRGRPRSATEGLGHFSTWLPEQLTWDIRAKAVALHKKDYEVVTEAIRSYLESRD